MEKFTKIILLLTGLTALVFFFLIKDLKGDSDHVLWRFNATKMHLSSECSMPYFTPVRCGGFHLAADTHDLIFSIYMLMSFIIPSTPWAIKLSNFLLSILLATGIYLWLKHFGITNQTVRIYTGILVSISGYWVCHLVDGGHVWAHGLAYTPFIMILIEDLLQIPPPV